MPVLKPEIEAALRKKSALTKLNLKPDKKSQIMILGGGFVKVVRRNRK